jgi:hypothetical protein
VSVPLSCSSSVLHFSPLTKQEKRPYWFISNEKSFIKYMIIHIATTHSYVPRIYVKTFQCLVVTSILKCELCLFANKLKYYWSEANFASKATEPLAHIVTENTAVAVTSTFAQRARHLLVITITGRGNIKWN